jgi:Kef-type K+ transport system membrane component KefB
MRVREDPIVFSIFLIFAGAALVATLALYARQAMLVAYILLGMILGPWGMKLVVDSEWIGDVSHIGIMFLLYLLGINLQPAQLARMFREALWVTVASSACFALLGAVVAIGMGFALREAIVIGAAMMFSSTIIGLKLLPTTTLHHQRMGQIMISVLLLQDLMAIAVLLLLQGYSTAHAGGGRVLADIGLQVGALLLLVAVAVTVERQIVERLIARFDKIQEYLFLLVIAWCLGIAEFARFLGLTNEIGAFIAGVALASSPIALFIAESLKPLRDFFLVMFFFSLGANFNLGALPSVFIPAAAIAILALAVKPAIFRLLLVRAGERSDQSLEIGARLGQISEFSLLISVLAASGGYINAEGAHVVELATLLSFVISTYCVVMRYPTPMAVSDRLRRD